MGDPLIPASLKPASGWERIASQADADRVGELFGGFHDSLIKELYLAARAAVDRDGGCTSPARTGCVIRRFEHQ